MKEVGVLEAKTNLSALLAEVESTGEPVAITRHGKRIARLTPEGASDGGRRGRKSPEDWRRFAEELRAWREGMATTHPGLAQPLDLRAERDEIE